MKRLLALLLSLSMVIALAACGKNAEAVEKDPAPESGSSAEVAEEDIGDTSDDPVPNPDPGDVSQPEGSVSTDASQADTPSVTLETVEDQIKADDGTVLVEFSYQKPTVSVPGNEEAASAIQADLDQVVEGLQSYIQDDLSQWAREEYSARVESGTLDESGFQAYYDELTMRVTRADTAVISLVIDSVGYSGGAHGWDNRYCRNYDVQTGEALSFDMLGERFRAAAEEQVLGLANTMQEEGNLFFENYAESIPLAVLDGTEDASEVYARVYPDLYGPDSSSVYEGTLEPSFYLNEEGVTFISGEYLMQSYAAGIIEFPFSYEDFAGIMSEQYAVK